MQLKKVFFQYLNANGFPHIKAGESFRFTDQQYLSCDDPTPQDVDHAAHAGGLTTCAANHDQIN